MRLLKDDELVPLVTGANPIVTQLPPPPTLPPTVGGGGATAPWYGKDSSVQPASLDLHVGHILLPGTEDRKPGSVASPKTDHVLRFGHTVVVTTLEEVRLPGDLAAFGFPPASISSRGLLMTNPGHVDRGYAGRLRFTVINVGREDIPLRRGDVIVTLLVVQLQGNSMQDWWQRRGSITGNTGPSQEEVDRLSADFLDVQGRATTAANAAVANAEFRAKWIPIVTALITALAAVIISFFSVWQPLQQIKKDIEAVNNGLLTASEKMDIRLAHEESRLRATYL